MQRMSTDMDIAVLRTSFYISPPIHYRAEIIKFLFSIVLIVFIWVYKLGISVLPSAPTISSQQNQCFFYLELFPILAYDNCFGQT